MKSWNKETGYYQVPDTLWQVHDISIPEGTPDIWLSKPGGSHYLGMSFHFAPYNFPEGKGIIDKQFSYSVSPFLLNVNQDSYNSWGVNACLQGFGARTLQEHWDWLPGVLIMDTSIKYTLPNSALAAFAGTEWADNDLRVFCGLYDIDFFYNLVRKFLELINRLTGPRWVGYPFGYRQLSNAVITWSSSEENLPDLLLLASTRQHGVKYTYLSPQLYRPSDKLGAWEDKPEGWDCRQAVRFLYQAHLMLDDGLLEMALATAVAAIENVSAEVLLYLFEGNTAKVQQELEGCTFLSRFDQLLPKHGVKLPKHLFEPLKKAYFARNEIIHRLHPLNFEKAEIHIHAIENVIIWYWENVSDGAALAKIKFSDNIPF